VALDRSVPALGAAHKRCPEAEILSQELDSASFAPASFDAIFAVNVAALHRDEALLRRVWAWLRPQGGLARAAALPRDRGGERGGGGGAGAPRR
jgi:trans-aconitate methyltransferase